MKPVPKHFYRQSGVVAFRRVDGQLQVLLITSRSGKRWIIPKGVVELTMTPWESAAKEAAEEAGVRGEVDSTSIGSYRYSKWGGTCAVEVFPLHVTDIEEHWEESDRTRRWLSPTDAAQMVDEPQLQQILRDFAPPSKT